MDMVLEVVSKYRTLVTQLEALIQVSGYKNDYIAKKVGITPANFSIKKSRQSFSLNEVEKILQVINNEDVEDYMLLQHMREIKDDETVSYGEFKTQMGWK